MRTLYFDCFSGISGDMTIGALLDLGLDFDYLRTELRKLPIEGYELKAGRANRSNISAMKFDVLIEGGHTHGRSGEHRHGGAHPHRKASQILDMVSASSLNANTRKIARSIFTKLAISEGQVHHVPPEDVEFHEVGAVDSIVDCVGAAIGFDALGFERFFCSPINVGSGFIHCQHGIYPVPTPATADLLRNATIYSKYASTELVTPTGAAILAAVVDEFKPLSGFAIDKIGYGAGTKEFPDFPNCLRLLSGREGSAEAERPAAEEGRDITVIETNIDDMTGENFGYVAARLLEAGALDVCTIPVLMKKSRPGYLLQVLAPSSLLDSLCRLILEETTTIGVRYYTARRSALERESVPVETPHGTVRVKVSRLDGRVVNVAPEYEDCARIALEKHVPLKEVQALALRQYHRA